jgi:Uncharacterized protein conserved in bacteria
VKVAEQAETAAPVLPSTLRRVVHAIRVEGSGPGRDVAAVAIGVFIGCTPFYGFHFLICCIVGQILHVNRLKMYAAANISNPLVAPWLLLAELQTGAWIHRGRFSWLTTDELRSGNFVAIGGDLLTGSLVVGGILAVLAAIGTHLVLRQSRRNGPVTELLRRAADRYVPTSITAWEFARGKLVNDPLYRTAVCGGVLPPGGTLLDVGCGQGLMLAALVEARDTVRAGRWAAEWPEPPLFERLIGVEIRPRAATIARRALSDAAEIVVADARQFAANDVGVVLLCDVLHMIERDQQEELLASLARNLRPGGTILVREADAAAGWRFATVRYGNRLKALAMGPWRQRFSYRSIPDWLACFERLGLRAEVSAMDEGTPFANVLFRVTAAPDSERTRR